MATQRPSLLDNAYKTSNVQKEQSSNVQKDQQILSNLVLIIVLVMESVLTTQHVKKSKEKQQPDGKTYHCPPQNQTNLTNSSLVCACVPGHDGLNCALVGGTEILPAVIAAGIIAAIIVLALLGLFLLGGGAFAAASAMAGTNMTSVMNNPIYAPNGAEAANPLYQG